ncbi:hypothetical protein C8J57DRAFT_1248144 [Mycena rebaudengoi]|nr:hypothetical protein C8J57DRAFT_1248144 [Mycena rebaudengoi]
MPQNIVSSDYHPPGKLLPETVGTYAQKSIILNFTLFILPFVVLGLGILTLGDRLGIYTHESPFALWYTMIYFAFCEGLSLLSIGWMLFPHIFRFHQFLQLIFGVRRHRSHFTFMSQRRINQLFWRPEPIFTIFVTGFRSRSLPIPVTGNTTIGQIYGHVESKLDVVLTTVHKYYYFTYMGRRIDWEDTVESLGIGALSHLQMRLRVLGGAHTESAPQASTSRSGRNANRTRMTDAIANDLAVPSPPKRRKRKSKPKPKPQNSDPEDSDFSGSESSESDSDIEEIIPNEELASTLPTKTVPEKSKRKTVEGQPRKRRKTTHKDGGNDTTPTSEPDDDTSMPDAGPSSSATKGKAKAKSGAGVGSGKKGNTSNAIYIFYESVATDAQGKSTPGSKYWKSYFGEREIIEIMEGANWNTRKLRVHLNAVSLPHFQLFQILQARSSPPTDHERSLACGATELTAEIAADYVEIGKRLNQNIKTMFEKQQAAAKVPWNQDHFETLVAKWVAACDQPFVAVMREEFCEMLEYAHHHSPTPLKIPSPDSVKGKIMKMSAEMVNELKAIFKVQGSANP